MQPDPRYRCVSVVLDCLVCGTCDTLEPELVQSFYARHLSPSLVAVTVDGPDGVETYSHERRPALVVTYPEIGPRG